MNGLNYKELQEQGVFDVPYKAFKFMEKQQKQIDELNLTIKRLINSEEDIARSCKGWRESSLSLCSKLGYLISKWKEEAKYREDITSEDWVSNTLNGCIEELTHIVLTFGEKND